MKGASGVVEADDSMNMGEIQRWRIYEGVVVFMESPSFRFLFSFYYLEREFVVRELFSFKSQKISVRENLPVRVGGIRWVF